MTAPKFILTLEDQCRLVFKTTKGNQMLFLFLQSVTTDPVTKQDKPRLDRWDDRYEFLNLMTNERHVLTCRQFNEFIDKGKFFDFSKSSKYIEHQYDLAKESSLSIIIHISPK